MSERGDNGGRVALVSGAAGGIGRAVTAALEDAGMTVVGFDQNRESGGWIVGDVRKDEEVAGAVTTAMERHGRLDVVVHAAGVTRDVVLWKLPPDDWDFVLDVNLRGAFLLLRHAIPAMRQGAGGHVVLIGSINGSRGKFGLSAYGASKAGLVGLAKSVARETARLGILVNVIEPGMVRTAMTEALPAKVREAAVEESLLGRLAEPSDVAGVAAFLCSPGARHITGQVIRVDGGQYL